MHSLVVSGLVRYNVG